MTTEQTNTSHKEQLEGLMNVAFDAVTPGVVKNLMGTVVQLMEMVDTINNPEMLELLQEVSRISKELKEMMKVVEELQATGGLPVLVEAMGLIKTARDALNSTVVTRGLNTGVKAFGLVDDMLQYEGDQLISKVLKAAYDSQNDTSQEGSIGVLQMMKMLKDPDIQKSLQFVFKLLKNLGKQLD
jgi:uncharacterized protein YjgD (DUF1641 family)